jgi:hypothetical protein
LSTKAPSMLAIGLPQMDCHAMTQPITGPGTKAKSRVRSRGLPCWSILPPPCCVGNYIGGSGNGASRIRSRSPSSLSLKLHRTRFFLTAPAWLRHA